MPFLCPRCHGAARLQIRAQIALGADSRSDEIALQLVDCEACSFRAVAVYEESRRGRLDDDSFDHYGLELAPDDVAKLRRLVDGCPAPGDGKCACDAHRALRVVDGWGHWIGIDRHAVQGRFPMILSA